MFYSGFVFDFDGLIIDTEIARFTAWQEVFKKYGYPLTYRDWWKTIGTGPSAYDPGQHLAKLTHGKVDKFQLRESMNNRASELLEKSDLLPGVRSFIEHAFLSGKPMTLASSSNRDWVIPYLERFDILKYFLGVYTAQDVSKVKPDPELYLLAVKKLGLPVSKVLAFEDSPNGIRAAKAAGLRCIAIPNQITREMDISLSDLVIESFEKINPSDSFDFA
jgi:HAD superfamily hydrolase (TIGR01509 family)